MLLFKRNYFTMKLVKNLIITSEMKEKTIYASRTEEKHFFFAIIV